MERSKIISMTCPYCGKAMNKIDSTNRTGPTTWSHSFSWRCSGNCVYIFTEQWLNDSRFGQCERFIKRASNEMVTEK